jgi:hypothetical protein
LFLIQLSAPYKAKNVPKHHQLTHWHTDAAKKLAACWHCILFILTLRTETTCWHANDNRSNKKTKEKG